MVMARARTRKRRKQRMRNERSKIIAGTIIGASLLGIGLKLAVLLTSAHWEGGYVILPPFPNILDSLLIISASLWLLILSAKGVREWIEEGSNAEAKASRRSSQP